MLHSSISRNTARETWRRWVPGEGGAQKKRYFHAHVFSFLRWPVQSRPPCLSRVWSWVMTA